MIAHLLDNTATVKRKTEVTNGNGSNVATWNSAYTGVACAIQIQRTSESKTGGAERGMVEYVGYFDTGTDILHRDGIIPDSGLHAGKYFEATGVGVDDCGRGVYVRVPLRLVEGGGLQ